MRLLLAEDERRVRTFIARGLAEEGFQITESVDGPAVLAALQEAHVDLVLLDWMLPGASGLDVLRQMRARQDTTPVIMLTARDALADRTAALNAGADDYLLKPFAFEELVARIRAVLRRAVGRASTVLKYEDLTLDPATRRVQRAGKEIRLTAREFALLQFLVEHAGEVISRARIVEAVWDQDYETFSNVVDVYVRYLRAKIDEPFPRRLIQTVRGAGYSLRIDD